MHLSAKVSEGLIEGEIEGEYTGNGFEDSPIFLTHFTYCRKVKVLTNPNETGIFSVPTVLPD